MLFFEAFFSHGSMGFNFSGESVDHVGMSENRVYSQL